MAGTILTTIGLSKLAAATPQNQLNITHIAVGDGNGGFPTLSPNATALTNEVWRGDASNPIKDGSNTTYVYFETNIPPEVGPFDVREIACFDTDGDMIAIGHTSLIQKPSPSDDASFAVAVKIFIALENASDFDLIYQNTEVTSHNSLTGRNSLGAHDDIYSRKVKNIDELKKLEIDDSFLGNTFTINEYHAGTGYGGGYWKCTSGEIENGFSIIQSSYDETIQFSLVIENSVNCSQLGFKGDALISAPTALADLISQHLTPTRYTDSIKNENATDNTPAWLHAWSLSKDLRLPLEFPTGDFAFKTSPTVDIQYDDVNAYGKGRSATRFWNQSANNVIELNGNSVGTNIQNIKMRDFSIFGDWHPVSHTGSTGYAILLDGVGNSCKFENMELSRNRRGMHAIDAFTVVVDNVRMQHNGEWGLWTQSASNAWDIKGSIINFNGVGGARIGGLGNTLTACNIEGNGGDQLVFNGRGNAMLGGYIEKPDAPPYAMVRIQGCTGWVIQGVFFDTLGGGALGDGEKYNMIVVEGGSANGEFGKGNILKNTGDDGVEVTVNSSSGGNNVFYMNDDADFINNASATNRRLSTTRIPQVEDGTDTISSGSSISHNLLAIPRCVNVTPLSSTPFVAIVTDRTDSYFTVELYDMAGAEIAGTRTVSWSASRTQE